jgi:AcrR family transcriptional regulator
MGLDAGDLNSGPKMDSRMRIRILEAGERAFYERGFFGISIRQIAREVGVHPALIGHYFGDKKGLLSEIALLIESRRPTGSKTATAGAGDVRWA